MGRATAMGIHSRELGVGKFIVFADFNCPFSYALNERLTAFKLDRGVDFRAVQHEPSISSSQTDFDTLSHLVTEVAELRRRAPSVPINVPLFRPNSGPAAALVGAVSCRDPGQGNLLRRQIFRALWLDGLDISAPEVLANIVFELGIDLPPDELRNDQMLVEWQQAWDSNPEFERNIPVIMCEHGDTVIGFPLEPELDMYLNTGSLIAESVQLGISKQQEIQRILILDDDVDSLRMVLGQMRDSQVEVASDFAELVGSAIKFGMPDMVLVNTDLIGGIDSTDWWRDSTDSDFETAVPVIFVANQASTEAEVAAFEAGAADFIAKPFHPRVLRARLNMHLQARRSRLQLNNIARVDSLTSICNRREFDLRLLSEWGRGARAAKSLALLMIDVDKFKEYNDHHGHLRGDDCLIAVAGILSDCMQRTSDLVARYGGEEFVALLPEADMEGAMTVAEECLDAVVGAQLPHVTSNVSRYVTVSIGVAAMVPIYEKSCTVLLEQADIALYQAKQNGRNQICGFDT